VLVEATIPFSIANANLNKPLSIKH